MLPKGRGSRNRGVAKIEEVDLEPIVCNAAGLIQAWHAFADLQVHPSVGYELAEILLGDDFFRNYVQADLQILIARHRSIVRKFLISRVRKRSRRTDMVLFKRHLVVVKLAQLFVVLPGNSNLLPPTMTQTR